MSEILKLQGQEDTPRFYIGKVSEATGASPKAIRHYEALGLIPRARRKGKYRIYSERDVFMIHMIKHAQTVGFTLSQMQQLTGAYVKSNSFPLAIANKMFDVKSAEFEVQINTILELKKRLESLRYQMNQIFG